MKRALAMLLLLTVALVGWLHMACGEEAACCCGTECACAAQAAETGDGGCPCDCAREQKRAEGGMPLCPVEWPEAMTTPETHTPVPPASCRALLPEEVVALSPPSPFWHAPPGAPPESLHTKPAPYAGFCAPLRA